MHLELGPAGIKVCCGDFVGLCEPCLNRCCCLCRFLLLLFLLTMHTSLLLVCINMPYELFFLNDLHCVEHVRKDSWPCTSDVHVHERLSLCSFGDLINQSETACL